MQKCCGGREERRGDHGNIDLCEFIFHNFKGRGNKFILESLSAFIVILIFVGKLILSVILSICQVMDAFF